jgi:two-component system chemotaxis response regulator CheY
MKALVIDDSRTMRRIVSRILTDFGYEVAEAADGQQALDALVDAPLPDLACIDWNMPVMDGLNFVMHVRADERLRGITLLMVTTESEYGQIVRALAAGAHEYLIKPFTADALQDKLALLGLLPAGIGEEVIAW